MSPLTGFCPTPSPAGRRDTHLYSDARVILVNVEVAEFYSIQFRELHPSVRNFICANHQCVLFTYPATQHNTPNAFNKYQQATINCQIWPWTVVNHKSRRDTADMRRKRFHCLVGRWVCVFLEHFLSPHHFAVVIFAKRSGKTNHNCLFTMLDAPQGLCAIAGQTHTQLIRVSKKPDVPRCACFGHPKKHHSSPGKRMNTPKVIR